MPGGDDGSWHKPELHQRGWLPLRCVRKAYRGMSAPHGHFKISLAEENSVKSYCFRGIKRLQCPSKDGKPTPKRRSKFAMTAGCLVGMMGVGTNQNYIGGGVPYPFAVFARPAKACLPLSVPHGYFKFSLAEENSANSYLFRGIKCLQSASLKMSGKCEMAMGLVVAMRLGLSLGLKSRGGYCPPVEFAGPAELCLFIPVPRSLSTSKPNSAAEIMDNLCTQFRILSKSENYEVCVVILPNLKLARMVQLSKANLKRHKSNPKDWLRVIASGCLTYLSRFVTQT